MRLAIYTRVSSTAQDVDLSIAAQLKALRDYATHNGHEVVREFIDEAESGRTADRPAFREMVALARSKDPPFQAIAVWKLNRFSRSRVDSITYKALLRKHGIEVISINEPLDDTPTGHLLEGMIECMDEFYSANLGQDIQRGMRENAARGFFNGSRPPYGLHLVRVNDGGKERNRLEPDPPDSVPVRTVKDIFAKAMGGLGCKEIAKSLNHEGRRTGHGRRWGVGTVHKVLTNEAYCGTLVWGGRRGHPACRSGLAPVRVENAWEAIISPADFAAVQERMVRRRFKAVHPRTLPSSYLLSGLVFCACGSAMTGRSSKKHTHYYYTCSRSNKQGKEACAAHPQPKDWLEEQVIGQVRRRVLADDNLERITRIVNEELRAAAEDLKERLEVIDRGMEDLKLRQARLYEVVEKGELDMGDVAPRVRENRSRLEELARARVQAEAEMVARGVTVVDSATVKRHAQDLRLVLEEGEPVERKALLRSFVRRIEVLEDRVSVHYTIPVPSQAGNREMSAVPSIMSVGGAEGTRTPDLLRE